MNPKDWFATQRWQPFDFQTEVWAAMGQGRSGLLHATTGSGKTLAVWLGALGRRRPGPGLQVLWLTPMRALAADTTRALQWPLSGLAPMWRVGQRTGDTPTAERARQERRWPEALVTTPESLSLLLTRDDARQLLDGVHTVVVDEWHELIGNKRGVQVQLALARLRRWNPGLMVWGMSATLGNLDEAMHSLLGPPAAAKGCMVRGHAPKPLTVDTLLPPRVDRFPWGGHLGLVMLPTVVKEIEGSGSTLVFTNTRSQAEIWYQALLDAKPQWAGLIALHHGLRWSIVEHKAGRKLIHEVRKACAWYAKGLPGCNRFRERVWRIREPDQALAAAEAFFSELAQSGHASAA